MEKKTTKKRTSKKTEESKLSLSTDKVDIIEDLTIANLDVVDDAVSSAEEDILDTTKESIEIIEEEKIATGIVERCSSLRVRSAPNLKSQELGLLKKGTTINISITKSTDNFYSVSYKGGEGFCLKTFIDIV